MQREELRSAITQLLNNELDLDLATIADDVSLANELQLDSMDMVSLVMRFEQQFRIRMTHEEIVTLANVGQILDLLQGKINESKFVAT